MKHLNLNLNKTLSPNSNIVLSSQQAIKSYIDSKKVFVQFLQESTPTTFKTGDKWVNTASNKLFIATNDTTWDDGSNLDITAIYSFENLLYHYNGINTKCYSTTSITEQNANKEIKEWFGTQDEYNTIETKDENTHYIIIDDASTSSSLLATQEEFNNSVTDKAATPKQVNEKIGNYLPLAGGNLDKGAILRFTNTNNQVSSMSLDENKYITMSDNLKVSGDINTNSLVSTTGNIYKGNSSGATNIWSDSFATTEKAGVIKVGNNLTIAEDGTLNAEAGGGGTKRSIGEVYFSQSSSASDNPGALPLFTSETIASANTIYPEFYNWVSSHPELVTTLNLYNQSIEQYGECPKYLIGDDTSNTVGWPFEKNKIIYTTNPNLTITIGSYNSSEGFSEAENYNLLYSNTSNMSDSYVQVYIDEELTKPAYLKYVVTRNNTTTTTYRALFIKLFNSKITLYYNYNNDFSIVYDHTDTTVTGGVPLQLDIDSYISLSLESGSIRLPLLKNYIKAATPSEGIKNIEAGLPNITGYLASIDTTGRWGLIANASADDYNKHSGAFAAQNNGSYSQSVSTGKGVASGDLYFDASLSNPIYGKSSTVTPASTTLYPWVVAYAAAVPASTAQAAEFQQGLSGKADTNLGNVASNIDYVVERFISGTSWYRRYKSGWLEQGGITPNQTSAPTITYLKAFADTNYSLLVTGKNNNSAYKNSYSSKTATGFVEYQYQAQYGCEWYACGQGAN